MIQTILDNLYKHHTEVFNEINRLRETQENKHQRDDLHHLFVALSLAADLADAYADRYVREQVPA